MVRTAETCKMRHSIVVNAILVGSAPGFGFPGAFLIYIFTEKRKYIRKFIRKFEYGY